MNDMSMRLAKAALWLLPFIFATTSPAQTLLNLDFGVGSRSAKTGFAASGQGTNDFWNLYRHYDPKFTAGMPLVANGVLENLKLADGFDTKVSVAVTNAPGMWGNASGDPMYDTYIFAPNGSNISVTLNNLEPGRYHVYLYGHADPDVTGEQNSVFTLRSGTNSVGPLASSGSAGWKVSSPWQERYQYVVFRDVPVMAGQPLLIEVAPGANGVAVLNGLQISSRGTSPPKLIVPTTAKAGSTLTNLIVRDIRYEGKVTDDEARFTVSLNVESMVTNEISAPLFEGDVAVVTPELPENWRIVCSAKKYRLFAAAPGAHTLKLELVAKITKAEPWNQISFVGPEAAIAAVSAQAASPGVDMQLLSGTQLDPEKKATSKLTGYLGPDRVLSMRWQSKAAEVTRKSLVTVDTAASALITPNVIKYTTQFRYEILQAGVPRLTIAFPTNHTLTKVQGEQIRDWSMKPDGARQQLTIEFIKPVEKAYTLTVLSEQALQTTPTTAELTPPQPMEIERESGSFALSSDDTQVEIDTASGLRQVNAASGALAAYRFYGRPCSLTARLKRIEPLVKAADRVTVRLEETRLQIQHALKLDVEKAGIYALDLTPQAGFVVAEVRGDGVEDWKMADGALGAGKVLRINFSSRVLGTRALTVQLEQALKAFPETIAVEPLRVAGATNETAQIGAASALGIHLKTSGELLNLREVPIHSLANRSEELLAFAADQGGWKLTLAAERLPARVLAEVFNLITIGDGLVGGSATIRYGIINQGVQEFKVKLPAHWKNIEFTGPNIRRKEQAAPTANAAQDTNYVTWTISLQDKAWGGYTLVITYDYQFNPRRDTLDLTGAHALNVERETGSVAVTTAASLKLQPKPLADSLHLIDHTELAETDRSIISRPVLLAYRYAGGSYQLGVEVTRHDELHTLDAVTDRTQLASVLNEEGQMLSQASFMVKNNDRQFQKFRLPAGATLWGCYVNNQSVKGELDGEWLAVSLPRGANRDEAFAVDIVYVQKFPSLKAALIPKKLELAAPQTDVPNTYAEWQVYLPKTQRPGHFGGSMTVAQGTTYSLLDAWNKFIGFYRTVFEEAGVGLVLFGGFMLLMLVLVVAAVRRGWRGILVVMVVSGVLVLMAGMLLPSLARKAPQRPTPMAGIAAEEAAPQIAAGPALDSKQEVNAPAAVPPAQPMTPEPPVMTQPMVTQPVPGMVANPAPAPPPPAEAAPVVAGLRSIHIDLPREGQSFLFTKVLHASDKPLDIQMSMMQAKWYHFWLSLSQVVAFVAGLLLSGWHLRKSQGNSFWLAIGLSLIVWAVGSLLLSVRALHLLLIGGLPLAVLWLLGTMLWKLWPRKPMARPDSMQTPAITLLALGLFLAQLLSASAQDASPVPSAVRSPQLVLSNDVSIVSAVYTGTVREKVAQFDTTLQITTFATNQIVPLFGDDVAIQEFSAQSNEIKLLRQGNGVAVRLGEKGSATLQMRLVVRLSGDVSKRRLTFNIPPALSSKLAMSIDEPDADVEFPSAVAFKRVNDKKETRVEAVLGSGDRVEMFWTPRMKRATEMAASVFVENTSLVSVGGGAVSTRTVLEYQVSQGELKQLKVRLPAGQRLLRVEGEIIRIWELNESGTDPVLTVELLKSVSPSYRLTVETEKVLEKLPARIQVEVPSALEVIRETGLVGLRGSEELSLLVESAPELQRVDVAEFGKTAAGKAEGLISAYRFLKPGFQLFTRAEAIQAQVEAVVRNAFRIGFEQINLSAQVDYTIKKAGLFSLKLELPKGVQTEQSAVSGALRVERVTGEKIAQWTERVEQNVRLLEVTFRERISGAYVLRVEMALGQPWKEVPKKVNLAGVYPLEVEKLNGYVLISSEAGIQAKTDGFTGLTEIPPTQALLPQGVSVSNQSGGSGGLLAFKFIRAEGDQKGTPWTLGLGIETVESWVRAEVVNSLSVSETLASGRALIRYEIMNAPIKEFRFKVPAGYTNIDVQGTNIRRRDQEGENWRVELQNKVRGIYTLTLTWEAARNGKVNSAVDVPGIEAQGVERETGFVVLLAKPPLQVLEKSATDQLVKIDARELPDWAGISSGASTVGSEAPVLVYRYLRPGFKLAVEAKRFEEAAVLQALVDNARLTTVIADDGQMMTEMVLAIRNNGLQYLEIEMPPGNSNVWSAFVAGQPVRPSLRAGRLLIPLERSGSDGAPVTVELTYVGSEKFPKRKGQVHLLSPKLDVPLKNARWDLYLPPDYEYADFEGSMSHVAEEAPVLQMFSASEYTRQENVKKWNRKAEVRNSLDNVKSRLSKGQVKMANEDFNQAFSINGSAVVDEQTKREVEGLKQQLKKAQGSNLINAQRAYSVNVNAAVNNGYIQEPAQQLKQVAQVQQQAQAVQFDYDADVAERQWEQLQKAQEITVTKVQPLRINLPTRGLRYGFAQALQTEVNKPMLIQFEARNTKRAGWIKQLTWLPVGFAILWVISAVAVNRPRRKKEV